MPQRQVDKNFFNFAAGLVTEVSPLNFPDGVSLDEENFELLIDGSRRRRKGIRLEEGGQSFSLVDPPGVQPDGNSAFSWHKWDSVEQNPDKHILVVQIGTQLYFYNDDQDTISDNRITDTVSLLAYATGTDDEVNRKPVTFASGRGVLFVAGKFITPFFIEFDNATQKFMTRPINMLVRDFDDVEDGIPVDEQPTGTLSDKHKYNLHMRGWGRTLPGGSVLDYEQYNTDKSAYPAKNMIPWKGYAREAPGAETLGNSTTSPDFWTSTWSSNKMEAEVFGNASAPRGSLITKAWDTTIASRTGDLQAIESWSVIDPQTTNPWTVTVTVTGHGLSNGNSIEISGNTFTYDSFSSGFGGFFFQATGRLDGQYTISNVQTNTFDISFPRPAGFINFVDQEENLGYLGSDVVSKPTGFSTSFRPTATAWFAGRIWFAGIDNKNTGDVVYFSQIVRQDSQFGRFYQEADPTAELFNALVPSDGGTIQVPGLGGTQAMLALENSVLIFSDNGVWQISGGQGFFSANDFAVRKVTDVEALSPSGIVRTDNGVVYTSKRGIYLISPDEQSGFLVARSLTETTIQSLWNEIPDGKQTRVQSVYDESLKRVYMPFTRNTANNPYDYDEILVLDLRLGSWYKYVVPNSNPNGYVTGMAKVRSGDATDQNNKIKFFVIQANRETLEVCDMNHTDFTDFDQNEQIPFLETGYDNVGDFTTFRQAPYVWTFMAKTETGYTEVGEDLVPINESGLLMQSKFDWADNASANKWGTQQQVYRHRRLYTPADAADTFANGQPVVVAKSKLRGRGRSLHLRFEGETGKDAHLYGWSLNYRGALKLPAGAE